MYKVVLLITVLVTQIVTSAVIQEIFTSDLSNFAVVEVVKLHKDKTVPGGFVIDEVDFVLIDYTKPMPKIPSLGEESEAEEDDECVDEDFEANRRQRQAAAVESGRDLEL